MTTRLFDDDETGKISFHTLKRVAKEIGETMTGCGRAAVSRICKRILHNQNHVWLFCSSAVSRIAFSSVTISSVKHCISCFRVVMMCHGLSHINK